MIFGGIDPGKTGAIAFVNDQSKVIRASEMPIDAATKQLDISKIYSLLSSLSESEELNCFIVIESLIAMPQQSVKSTITSGVNYGKLITMMELLKIPYQEVAASKWKKEFQLYNKTKYISAGVASQLFPDVNLLTERGRLMDGVAEALLLAEYAKRIYTGEKINVSRN